MPTTVEELLQYLPIGLLGVNNAVYTKLLDGLRIDLAIEGSRNFDGPHGLGMGPYDGCQIIVFHDEFPPAVAGALTGKLAHDATDVVRLAGQRAFVFEEKHENDWWQTYIAMPQPNVLLCATSPEYLEEVLQRRMQHAKPGFLGDRFYGWEKVDKTAHAWAIHHFKYGQRRLSGLNRLIFSFIPSERDNLKIEVVGTSTHAVKEMAKEMGAPDATPSLKSVAREIRPVNGKSGTAF